MQRTGHALFGRPCAARHTKAAGAPQGSCGALQTSSHQACPDLRTLAPCDALPRCAGGPRALSRVWQRKAPRWLRRCMGNAFLMGSLIASPHAQRRRAPRRLRRRVCRAAGGDPGADPGAARGRARAHGAQPCGAPAGGAGRAWRAGRASSAGRGRGGPRRGARGRRGGGRRCGGAAGRRHARADDARGARRSAGAGGGRQRERPAPSRRAARSPSGRTSSRALSRAWRVRASAPTL
jgi:hypothetical protein